jgi:hypothetical protein
MSPGDAYPVLRSTLPGVEPAAGESAPTPAPWEASVQATCDSLSLHGTLDAVERRQAEDELGASIYADFPVPARPVIVTAHALLERGEISEHELEAKMNDVRARFRHGLGTGSSHGIPRPGALNGHERPR